MSYLSEWKRKNPQKIAEYRIRAKPRDRARIRLKWASPEGRKALQVSHVRYRRNLKLGVYAAYGGFICKCCGETREAFLSLDHVNNDGAEHRRTFQSSHLYQWLRKRNYPPGFQVLCMNCNFGKRMNNGICPHETERSAK